MSAIALGPVDAVFENDQELIVGVR